MLQAMSLLYFSIALFGGCAVIAGLLASNLLLIKRALGVAEDCVILPMPRRPLNPDRQPRIFRVASSGSIALRAAA